MCYRHYCSKMKRKKAILFVGICCAALYLVSVYFFITRDKAGNYNKLVSYEDLYSNRPKKLEKWKHILKGITDEAEIREAQTLTREYAGVSDNDPAFTKMLKIAAWIKVSYRNCPLGEPDSTFSALPLLEQYRAACRAESPIWCGTFARHFLLFCSANGLDCRFIEQVRGDYVHAVNETYIPELGRWVFTDLMTDALFCEDTNGNILNTVDLLNINLRKDDQPVRVFFQKKDADEYAVSSRLTGDHWQNYFNEASLLNFYYTVDLKQVYNPGAKLLRYAFPVSWYESYSKTPPSNTSFYLRILFLYAGIVLTITFIVLYIKRND